MHEHGAGRITDEPSVVAVEREGFRDGRAVVVAAGKDAEAKLDRVGSNIIAERPLKDGTIEDPDLVEAMLRYFLEKGGGPKRYTVAMIGVPVSTTLGERRIYEQVCEKAGIDEVFLEDEVRAAAKGAGLKVGRPQGHMVVDIGGGTTDVAVISHNSIIEKASNTTAGDAMDKAIQRYIRNNKDIDISIGQAETIKKAMGSAIPVPDRSPMKVTGQHRIQRRPAEAEVNQEDIRQALKAPVDKIVHLIMSLLERTPPALAEDVYKDGILLVGGGSILEGLDKRIEETTKLPVRLCEDPQNAVIKGLEMFVDQMVRDREG